MVSTIELKQWHYKEHCEEQWHASRIQDSSVAEIFPDLMNDGKIPDPFVDLNERKVQWVGERDWDYQSKFQVDSVLRHSVLRFQGLDTFAKIYLNGELIGESEDMFELFELDVSKQVSCLLYTSRCV